MSLAENLKQIIKGEVYADETTRSKYSKDASMFEVMPRVVVAPKDVNDIKALVKFVNEHKDEGISLTPRSAGTCMTGGPLTESIVVDFLTHFQGTLNVDEEKMEATVLPGTYYRDFEKETLKHDLLLPCYTASRDLNTVGGMVANNSGGEKTLTYGKTEDYIKQLKVVFADGNEYVVRPLSKKYLEAKINQGDFEGNVYKQIWDLVQENEEALKAAKPKVSKNSAGYYLWNVWDGETFDLTKLIVGSQGTLGIVTEITFKLVKPNKHSTLLVIFMQDLSILDDVINRVLKHKPESFESYGENTTKIALKYMPEMAGLMGAKNLVSLGLKFLPEMWMFITGGTPKLVATAEFTGESEEEIYEKALKAQKDLDGLDIKTHITKNDAEEEKYWTVRRQSFNLLRHHIRGKHTAPFIDDIAVRPEELPEFLPKLQKIMSEYDITFTIAGHVGDGNFHIIPLMNYKRPDFKKIIADLSDRVYNLVLKHGGSITGEHNDGLIRTPYLERMYGEKITKLFTQTKNIFDPDHIMNPGKKVSEGPGEQGSIEYVFSHLLKD